MVTYSCGRLRGPAAEFDEQSREIPTREGPLERLRRSDVMVLEAKKTLTDRVARRKVVGREHLALDDREIDLDLIEPAGVDGGMDQYELRPPGLQPCDCAVSSMCGAIVHDPEDAAGRAI